MKLFNPVQFKEFGGNFFEGSSFSVRFAERKFFRFYNSIFIPLGPIVDNENGFSNFLNWCKEKKRTKIFMELPPVYVENEKEKIIKKIIKFGFKSVSYKFHDEETLLIFKEKYQPKRETRYKIRYCQRSAKIVIIDDPEDKRINDAYIVYKRSAERINYSPKPVSVFRKILENGILAICYNDEDMRPIGFALGYIQSMPVEIVKEGVNLSEQKIMFIVLSGSDHIGRKLRVGYGLWDAIIRYSFENLGVNIVDVCGAGRKMYYPYLEFKMEFSNYFFPCIGAFSKTNLF